VGADKSLSKWGLPHLLNQRPLGAPDVGQDSGWQGVFGRLAQDLRDLLNRSAGHD
jgi:hypothetical protein